MNRLTRRSMVLGLVATAGGFGCGINPLLIPDLISGGRESKIPAEFPLTVPKGSDQARVVILVSAKPGLPTDLAGVDRLLNAELITELDNRCRGNEEKVLVLKMPPLDKFRQDNPNIRRMHPKEIGKKLDAHYVIDVEITEMDLFKPGPTRNWLLGTATLSVTSYDVSKPLKEAGKEWDMSFEYPQGREIELVSPSQLSTFRRAFVQRIASDVAVKFTTSTAQRRID